MRLLYADTIRAPAKEKLYPRLEKISRRLHELLDEWKPDEVAVEDVFYALNARSAFHLGMARGVAVAACLGRQMKIFEYAPTQVKSIVTGYGRADKAQVKKMIQLLLGTREEFGFDTADAIAVALCHAVTARFDS